MIVPYDENLGTGVTLYHGDACEVMDQLEPQFDLIITSPPYNLRNTSGGSFSSANRSGKWQNAALAHGYEDHADDLPYEQYVLWQQQVWHSMWRLVTDSGAILYVHKPRIQRGSLQMPTDLLPPEVRPYLRQVIIWQRNGGMNFNAGYFLPSCEWILLVAKPSFRLGSQGAGAATDVWHIAHDPKNTHPAPFPLELVQHMLRNIQGPRILDPFIGSGTTAVAAWQHGRSCVGIDITKRYLTMTQRRVRLAAAHLLSGKHRHLVDLGQMPLFADDWVEGQTDQV